MDYIEAEEQRNFQAAFLDGDTLKLVNLFASCRVEDRTKLSFANRFLRLSDVVHVRLTTGLAHLAELFGERHLTEQSFNGCIERGASRYRRRLREQCDVE